MAFIRIQKTGGTSWENHLFKHLQVKHREGWINICSYSNKVNRSLCLVNSYFKPIIWDHYIDDSCDLHADYTELRQCILRDYIPFGTVDYFSVTHLMTFLRNPVDRFISEYEHAKLGATWPKSVRICPTSLFYLDKCYTHGKSWANAKWEAFLNCENNLANNRQVRMLADFGKIGCQVLDCFTRLANCTENMKKLNEARLLESAKHTLLRLSFFGMAEYQTQSEFLFLKTLDDNRFRFSEPIKDKKDTLAAISMKGEAGKHIDRIKAINHLDIQLYEFAKDIFFKRVAYFQNEKK